MHLFFLSRRFLPEKIYRRQEGHLQILVNNFLVEILFGRYQINIFNSPKKILARMFTFTSLVHQSLTSSSQTFSKSILVALIWTVKFGRGRY